MIDHQTRLPTHICLDCGALGYAGGYHDHGGGNAGDTTSLSELLKLARRAGEALDALDVLCETLSRVEVRGQSGNVEDYDDALVDALHLLGAQGDEAA